MAHFLDEEAEVTDEEEEDNLIGEDEDLGPRKKSSKKKKSRDLDDTDEEEEEEDEEAQRAEMADFIQDEPDEPAEDAGESRQKRKRSEEPEDEDLEDEDYDLIRENLGVEVKKVRRVRTMADDDDDMDDRDAIAGQLFDGQEDEGGEAPAQKNRQQERAQSRPYANGEDEIGEDDEEGSDTDSFIVDDEGKPIHSQKNRRGPRMYADAMLQEAQDIFGLDFDVADLEDNEDEYEEDGEYEEEDEDGNPIKLSKRRKPRKSVMDVYEPTALEHSLLTQRDNTIKIADIPERFQLRSIPVEPPVPPEERATAELMDEARWIIRGMFEEGYTYMSDQEKVKKTITRLACVPPEPKPPVQMDDWGNPVEVPEPPPKSAEVLAAEEKEKMEQRITKAKEILDFIRTHFLEDRFITTYRKEYYYPVLNGEEIREIYERDLLWMQLQRRRNNLVKLMLKMQEYLRRYRLDNPETFEEWDEVSDEAVDEARNASSMEELADIFVEFKMKYGRHMPSVQKTITTRKESVEGLDESQAMMTQIADPDASTAELNADARTSADLTMKRARRTDPYVLCKQAGLDKFVAKYGITAEQIAINCTQEFNVYQPEQEMLDPETLAEEFKSTRFPTSNDVIQGSVYMLASLLARNAQFRRVVRKRFRKHAVVNIQCTSRGFKEIDENHPCYAFKWVKDKPIATLSDDQYLRMVQAKKEGQLEMTLGMPKIGENSDGFPVGQDMYLLEIAQWMTVDEERKTTKEWNDLRIKAVERALQTFLYPAFEKEVHEKLLEEAKLYVKVCIRGKLFDWLNVAPYATLLEKQEKEEKDSGEEGPWDLSNGIRVMGIAFEDSFDAPGFAAVVDCFGDLVDSVKLPTICKRQGTIRVNPDDIDKIIALLRDKKPHVVALAAEAKVALDIREALQQKIAQLKLEDRLGSRDIPVEIVDNLVGLLYQNSETGRMEFPQFAHTQRQAISVARRLLDPLLVFCQLFNMDDDLLNLNFHPLQAQLSKDEFRRTLEIELVRRVNEVGVDINESALHPLTHGPTLQFVCGLGPRKAQHLFRIIKSNGVIASRNQLVMTCKLGPKVFVNCAGFIRINANELSDSVVADQYVEPLDASRVHPETYDWARKMAVDALDYDDSVDGANPSDALLEILEKPQRLEELNLEAFGDELERQNLGNKRITLYEIQQELHERFRETRKSYTSPDEITVFSMIVGEPIEDYRIGRLMTVTVCGFRYFWKGRDPDHFPPDYDNGGRFLAPTKANAVEGSSRSGEGDWFCPKCRQRGFATNPDVFDHMNPKHPHFNCPGIVDAISVRLDNGVFGKITLDNLSNNPVVFPQERVKLGMAIHARLIKLEPAKFLAEFTSKSSDLADQHNQYKPPKDVCYDYAAETETLDRETKKRNQLAPKPTFLKRVIAHPAFKNVNFEDAERYLRNAAPGEAIIRPSSKGSNKLTVSWKVAEGILDHVEVLEQDKENAFSLGQKLVIADETYDDLDEILARFINPMTLLVNDLFQHKYYVDSHFGQSGVPHGQQRAVIDKWLIEQKQAMPARVPFCFSALCQLPRKFFLCHLPNQNVREEFVTVTPVGYFYRKRNFVSMNELVKYFKNHFHEAPPAATVNGNQSVAMNMSITPGTITPRHTHLLNQAFQSLPATILDKLRDAGVNAKGGAGTPMAFATPRTPSGNHPTGVRGTPASSTPVWGNAAATWNRMAQPQGPGGNTPNAPNTPQEGTPQSTTNWSAAGNFWGSSQNNPANAPR